MFVGCMLQCGRWSVVRQQLGQVLCLLRGRHSPLVPGSACTLCAMLRPARWLLRQPTAVLFPQGKHAGRADGRRPPAHAHDCFMSPISNEQLSILSVRRPC